MQGAGDAQRGLAAGFEDVQVVLDLDPREIRQRLVRMEEVHYRPALPEQADDLGEDGALAFRRMFHEQHANAHRSSHDQVVSPAGWTARARMGGICGDGASLRETASA